MTYCEEHGHWFGKEFYKEKSGFLNSLVGKKELVCICKRCGAKVVID